MFKDREQAGKLLAAKIHELLNAEGLKPTNTIVIGLPRGGVPVAKEVASSLNAKLSVIVSKKIGAPFQPEFAIGAVSSTGEVVLNEQIYYQGIEDYIGEQTDRLKKSTQELERHWLQAGGIDDRKMTKGKRVVLVDDGVATGMTVLAAVRSLKKEGASEIIVATPVISVDANALLQRECDRVVSLITPIDFLAIGNFYKDFHQVEDAEVIEALKASVPAASRSS